MDSEEEDEGPETDKGHVEKRIENEVIQEVETKKSEETKAPGIALPITEMTDDWMDDDVAIGNMDSEEEDEGPETDKGHVEKRIENKVIQKVETKKSEETKAPGIALPITEMTDDWMDDDVAIGSMDSEEEEEGPESDKGHVEKRIENEVIQKVETNMSEETKAPGIALPITE